jgi:hypothetical protein
VSDSKNPKKFEFINNGAKRAFKALPKDIQYQFGTDQNADVE